MRATPVGLGRAQKLDNGYCILELAGSEAPRVVSSCRAVAKLLECMLAPSLHELAGEDVRRLPPSGWGVVRL